MLLVQVAVTLIVLGSIRWLVNRFASIQRSPTSTVFGAVVISSALWCLNSIGCFAPLPQSLLNRDGRLEKCHSGKSYASDSNPNHAVWQTSASRGHFED